MGAVLAGLAGGLQSLGEQLNIGADRKIALQDREREFQFELQDREQQKKLEAQQEEITRLEIEELGMMNEKLRLLLDVQKGPHGFAFLAEMEAKTAELTHRIETLSAEVQENVSAFELAEMENEGVPTEAESKQTRIENLTSTLAAFNNKMKTLTNQLEGIEDPADPIHAARFANLNQEMALLADQSTVIQSQLFELQGGVLPEIGAAAPPGADGAQPKPARTPTNIAGGPEDESFTDTISNKEGAFGKAGAVLRAGGTALLRGAGPAASKASAALGRFDDALGELGGRKFIEAQADFVDERGNEFKANRFNNEQIQRWLADGAIFRKNTLTAPQLNALRSGVKPSNVSSPGGVNPFDF